MEAPNGDTAPKAGNSLQVLLVGIHPEGHFGPLCQVARLLAEKHHVTVASLEKMRGAVESRMPGVKDFIGAASPWSAEEEAELLANQFDQTVPPRKSIEYMAHFFCALELAMATALFEALDSGRLRRPDVVVMDVCSLAGLDVAVKYGIPYVQMNNLLLGLATQFVGPAEHDIADPRVPYESMGGPSAVLPERMSLLQYRVINPLLKRYGMLPVHWWATPIQNEYRAKLGLPPVKKFWERPANGPRAMTLLGVSWEQETRRRLPDGWHVVGPMGHDFSAPVPELKDAEVAAWLAAAKAAGRRVVYVATGSVVVLRDWQVQTIARAMLQVPDAAFIWSLKEEPQQHLPQEARQAMSDGRLLVKAWLPQPALLGLPQVELFVSHGGQNSINEGLATGTPVLALPFGGDQYINAMHVVNKGVGEQVDPWTMRTHHQLAQTIQRMLATPRYGEAAAALGRAIRRTAGPVQAATMISQFAREEPLTLPPDALQA